MLRSLSILVLTLGVAWIGLPGIARADVGDVTPNAVAVGHTFDVEVPPEFGDNRKKIKVRLTPSVETGAKKPKRPKVKVHAAVLGLISCTLKRGLEGKRDVTVSGPGQPDFVILCGLVIKVPTYESITPNPANPKDLVTVIGVCFGKKGKVCVGGKKAKVKVWTDTMIQFVVPKKVKQSPAVVEIKARAGSAVLDGPDALEIELPPVKKKRNTVDGTIDGKPFRAKGRFLGEFVYDPLDQCGILQVTDKNVILTVQVQVPGGLDTGPFSKCIDTNKIQTPAVSALDISSVGNSGYVSVGDGTDWKVTIEAAGGQGEQVCLTITGTLHGDGKDVPINVGASLPRRDD